MGNQIKTIRKILYAAGIQVSYSTLNRMFSEEMKSKPDESVNNDYMDYSIENTLNQLELNERSVEKKSKEEKILKKLNGKKKKKDLDN